ncbi:MAG TPA: methyl-accepting chemotaxis protein, partial [Noviherbaspirillum sp.]|nr:methyl-accepting chemotaxis protein [Noviherbaspirillum sp.]
KHVADIMNEITAASQEQSSGIEEVNHAIAQMDEMTQQNAALVEQAAATAESMQQQSASLAQAVSVFKVLGNGGTQLATAANHAPVAAKPMSAPATRRVAMPRNAMTPAAPKAIAQPKQTAPANEGDWEEF